VQAERSSRLVIFGAGGHGRVVADAALAQGAWSALVATDRDPQRCRGELLPGVACVSVEQASASSSLVHVAIGSAEAREREAAALGASRLASVVHPRASVSAHAQIGPGTFVAAQAVVAPGAQVGTSVIVNHGAVVDHDVRVGDFSHIAPLVALGGGARIGRHVLVGSGARVLPGVSIADGVTIGAGAVVRESITEAGTYAGVPARRVK
jgi:sugar O-acyltransferase (sialic acid O-acetyltransferase NeuD family)